MSLLAVYAEYYALNGEMEKGWNLKSAQLFTKDVIYSNLNYLKSKCWNFHLVSIP